MAKLPVKFLKLFGGLLSPGGNIAQFGSLAATSPAFSNDPDVIQALAAWQNGMAAALINTGGGQSSPALEDFNGLLYVLSYMIAYLKQEGIAEYDPAVTYYINSIVKDPATGALFVSKTDNNTGNPLVVGTNWKTYASTLLGANGPLLKGWVIFDGRTGAIDSAFNVSSVVRTSAGCYTINFAAAMADALYGFTGSCSTRPGVGWISGDDNLITGGAPGKTVIRTVNQCTVFSYDRGDVATQDSSLIAIQFFGNPT